jgi:hypothetical protein
MTAAEFRAIALSFPEAEERSHMSHPDFRVRGKIFATLAYPNKDFGMVKLPPRAQEEFVFSAPKAFVPVTGAWGRQGATSVLLKAATKASLRRAMSAAWNFAAPKDVASPKQTKPSKRGK